MRRLRRRPRRRRRRSKARRAWRGADSLEELVAELDAPAAHLDHGARPRSSTRRSPRWRRCSSPATRSSTAATRWYHDDVDRAEPLAERARHPLPRRRHERRHARPRARLLPDGRRRRRGRRPAGADLRHAGARRRRRRAHPGPRAGDAPSTAEQGWLHCGPSGAGHFVKMVHNGIEYGLMAAYAEGLNVLAKADIGAETHAKPTPRRRRSPHPEYYQYDLDLAAITEVWRRGQRRRQLAARPHRRGAARRPAARRVRRAASATAARGAGRSTPRSTRACRCRCCRPRCSSASAPAAGPTSPTRCCRRCAPGSAATSSSTESGR